MTRDESVAALVGQLLWGPPWAQAAPLRIAALGAATTTALLLLLYVVQRRGYVALWTSSWALLAASLLVAPAEYSTQSAQLVRLGLAQALNIGAGLLMMASARSFRRHTIVWRLSYAIGAVLLVAFMGLSLALGHRLTLVLGYAGSGIVLASGAVSYLRLLRSARLIGAGVIGGALLLVAASHAWIAALVLLPDPGGEFVLQLLQQLSAFFYVVSAFGMLVFVFDDITYELKNINRQLEVTQAELRQIVITDPLTSSYNRRFFDEVIKREINRHQRYGVPLSLLFVDVNHFKAVNDSLGHETGDLVLQQVARFLRGNVREADYVFRWGGDEFLLLLSCSEVVGLRKAVDLKRTFLSQLSDPPLPSLPEGFGLSIGVVEFHAGGDISALIREADRRMYLDKEVPVA